MAGIFKLTSGGLMVNYRCQAACGHCMYNCSHEREEHYISYEDACRVFQKALQLSAPSMHLSGGEPFIHVDALCEVLRAAKDTGMPIDYLDTSASWVTDEETARAAILRIKDFGIDSISVSISPYHNEYIPLDRVLTLMQVCEEQNVTATLWLDEFLPDMTVFPTDRPHSRQEYTDFFNRNYWGQLPPRYSLYYLGRAALTHRDDMPTYPTTRIPHMSRSCAELGKRSHYHIDCFGNYIPPGCPGLALPLDALGHELDPEEFPIYTRLAQEPRALLDFCKSHGFAPANNYYNRCHLCQDMRLFLFEKFPGRFRELAPSGFYESLLREKQVEINA